MCISIEHWNERLPIVQFKCPGVNIDFVKLKVVLEIQQQMRHVCVGKMLAVSRHVTVLHKNCGQITTFPLSLDKRSVSAGLSRPRYRDKLKYQRLSSAGQSFVN